MHDLPYLLAPTQRAVVVPDHAEEDCPHHFWEVNSALVVSDVETVNYLVQLLLVHFQPFVSQRRRQLLQKRFKELGLHVVLTLRVKLGPRVDKVADVPSFDSQDLCGFVISLNTFELFVDNCNEHVDVYEVGDKRKKNPENIACKTNCQRTVMHNSIPCFTCHAPEKSHHGVVKRVEVGLRIYVFFSPHSDIPEKIHGSY